MESISYRWNHEVEYVMTEKGLERVSKQNEESDNNENDNDDNKEDENKAIEDFRKSRDQIEEQRQQKLRELEEIEKELKKTTDSSTYRYRPPATPKPEGRSGLRAEAKIVQDSFKVEDLLLTF